MTYVLISLPFLLAGALCAAWRWRRFTRQGAVVAIVMAIVLALTVVFDNLMIAFGNVGYGDSQNLGLYLGLVPIEDLFYPIFAVLVVTALWPED